MKILEVKDLTKKYGDMVAVNGISFSVEQGEIFGLVGPNGAGKSTTINMITGLLVPNGGSITFDGGQSFQKWRGNIGLVPQDLAIYPELSARENVNFFAGLYGLKGAKLKERVEFALEMVGLLDQEKKHSEHFSGGMKRRLNIACALAHKPKLIIMDEPTVGIDPQSRNYILEGIKALKDAGTTVIYTSHYMEEVNEICDRILIVDHGTVVESGATEEIKERYRTGETLPTLEEVFLTVTGKELRDE